VDKYKILNSLDTLTFLLYANLIIDIDSEYLTCLNDSVRIPRYGTCKFDLIKRKFHPANVMPKIGPKKRLPPIRWIDTPVPPWSQQRPRSHLEKMKAYSFYRLGGIRFFEEMGLIIIDSVIEYGNYTLKNGSTDFDINPNVLDEIKTFISQIYFQKYAQKYPVKTKFGCFLDHPINSSKSTKSITDAKDDILYDITFTENKILLNGSLISKPNYDSENANFFKCLIQNPNRNVSKDEFKSFNNGKTIGKSFHKILENLGFKKDFRKTFFKGVTNETIHFRNPITREEFARLKLPALKIPPSSTPS